jgi:hypothetical protein
MAFPSERGAANVTLFEPSSGGGTVLPSERGTQSVTLFDPSGPVPIVASGRGTKNVTLFDPAPDAVAVPSARGTANVTLAPALADDSPVRLVTWNEGTESWDVHWFRFVVRTSGSWVFQ